MVIHGLNKLTLLDYPGRLACTVFTGGCSFRCPFCQNGSLVLSPGSEPVVSENEFFSFLESRKGKLDGVCISGGEPTLQKDLTDFIKKVRRLGFKVKLDTNGYQPDVLEKLIGENLLDYVAMDVKSSKKGYSKAVGVSVDVSRIECSLDFLKASGISYELRTTVVRELHNEKTLLDMAHWLKDTPKWYLQQYVESDLVIDKAHCSAYSEQEMKKLLEKIKKVNPRAELRGI